LEAGDGAASSAPTPTKKSSDSPTLGDGADASSKSEDVSIPGDNGATSDQPSWLAHALTDEELTAQFLADEVKDDGDAIHKRSHKHKHAPKLGIFQRFTKPTAAVEHEPERETKEGAYVRALNERAARALRHD
jgi:hypothetical protein